MTYPIVETGQVRCFDNSAAISCPADGLPFSGQDAQYNGLSSAYQDNGDGTVTDLMWQQAPDLYDLKTFDLATGWMESPPGSGIMVLWNVHGAGAQRSDPKVGDPADYPYGFGPQGDVIRIFNYSRCVRTIE